MRPPSARSWLRSARACGGDQLPRQGDRRDELLRAAQATASWTRWCTCSLLAEGVDLPWLEWLCLRRGAGSRVRLAQEVGRVVRTYQVRAAHGARPPQSLLTEQDNASML